MRACGPGKAAPSAGDSIADRLLRLHAFEVLIFVVLFILLAMCLAAAPVVAGGGPTGNLSSGKAFAAPRA